MLQPLTSSRSHLAVAAAFALALAFPTFSAAQKPDNPDQDKHLDIRTSAGDLHLGNDGDAGKVGLPLYPGARPKHDDDNKNAVNLGILTDALGIKLVIASYESDDAPGRIVDYYRDKLKKFGKVLECHTHKHSGDVHADVDDKDDKDDHSRALKCDGDNSGPVTELKVGTKNNQHVVAIEPRSSDGATFALVYVHVRDKEGEI
jgi:hypothetical protein